ncbi:MAG: 4'-phosphopantetheinyl transferase superfamily protein [Muribaculaceae bacterium]
MAFYKDIAYENGTHIYQWRINESVDDLRYMCLHRGIDIEEIDNVTAKSRQAEMLTERLLLQLIFGKNVTLIHNADGAPCVLESDYNISITHTSGIVCVATHPTQRIGIDIEQIRTRVIKVRNKFLNDHEKQWILEDDVTANLIAWTAKEALFKIIPENEIDFKEHLQLESFTSQESGQFTFKGTDTRTTTPRTYDIITNIELEYILSLAIARL